MKRHNYKTILISLTLLFAMIFNISSCSLPVVKADDLMENITPEKVSGKETDDLFGTEYLRFALDIFKLTADASKNENVLISPLSLELALAMTANGTDTQTKKEFEQLFGIKLDDLNEYLYTYASQLPSESKSKLEIANSIWFRDSDYLTVYEDFLQKNADYYSADAYKSPFDGQTVNDMNAWTEKNTDGMIKKIIETILPDNVMFLLNAIVFDSEWEEAYEKSDIYTGAFSPIVGDLKNVEMMRSEENIYLDDGNAKGFMRPYKNNNYSFAALLPNEDVDLYKYIDSLTAEGIKELLNEGKEQRTVQAVIPKFTYEFDIKMNDILKNLGVTYAFDPEVADFSKLGKSLNGKLCLGNVIHKTFISLDEKGTKAAAVTRVDVNTETAFEYPLKVTLDRPFVYMIVDNATSLPVFIGTVTDII